MTPQWRLHFAWPCIEQSNHCKKKCVGDALKALSSYVCAAMGAQPFMPMGLHQGWVKRIQPKPHSMQPPLPFMLWGWMGAQRGLWFAVSAPVWLFQLKLRGRCPFTTRAPGGGEVKLWLTKTGLSSQRSAADGGRMEHINRKRQ